MAFERGKPVVQRRWLTFECRGVSIGHDEIGLFFAERLHRPVRFEIDPSQRNSSPPFAASTFNSKLFHLNDSFHVDSLLSYREFCVWMGNRTSNGIIGLHLDEAFPCQPRNSPSVRRVRLKPCGYVTEWVDHTFPSWCNRCCNVVSDGDW